MERVSVADESIASLISIVQETCAGMEEAMLCLKKLYLRNSFEWTDKQYRQIGDIIELANRKILMVCSELRNAKLKLEKLYANTRDYLEIKLDCGPANADNNFSVLNGATYPQKLHRGRQEKHIKGTNNYQEGKSYIILSVTEIENLIKVHGGTGQLVADNKERVNFNCTIGYFIDRVSGEEMPTTVGIIHYSADGVHIVPARPREEV